MRFFVDNCIAPPLAQAMQLLSKSQGIQVEHLKTYFPPETKDVDWIRQLGAEGDWLIVSGDPSIARNKAEKAVWKESRLTAFFFGDGWASRRFWVQAHEMVRWWPLIIETSRVAPAGKGFLLPFKSNTMRELY